MTLFMFHYTFFFQTTYFNGKLILFALSRSSITAYLYFYLTKIKVKIPENYKTKRTYHYLLILAI